MNSVLLHGDDRLLDRLGDFIRNEPPKLREVLAACCELYHADPGEIDKGIGRSAARDMFCYVAHEWCGVSTQRIGQCVGLETPGVLGAIFSLRRQSEAGRQFLRDDLDLIAVRLAERVMTRRRAWRCR